MRTAIAIAVAGAIGALARYGLEGLVSRRTSTAFPWGTFAVNVSGAFVLGLVFTLMTEQFTVAPWIRGAVTIGLLGAYTTFSTLSMQVYRSTATGHLPVALANAVGSLIVGTLAVYAGIALTRAF